MQVSFEYVLMKITLKLFFSRFLDQSLSNNEEKLEKHRFLVQSKIIEDVEYGRILNLSPQARSDEVRKTFVICKTPVFYFFIVYKNLGRT